jgi:hypothetical protein
LLQGKSQGEALAFLETAAKAVTPEGYRVVLSGSAETYKDSFQSLLFALILGLFVAYMVLGAQFNSFVHPLTVLMALPFSITGAFIALRLTGITLNIYSMIGLLLFMGIVKKNSILLVDFTNERRKNGFTVRQALLEACPMRLRPILMTTVSTVVGAIPPRWPWARERNPFAHGGGRHWRDDRYPPSSPSSLFPRCIAFCLTSKATVMTKTWRKRFTSWVKFLFIQAGPQGMDGKLVREFPLPPGGRGVGEGG